MLFLCDRQIFVFVLDLTYIFHAGKVLVKCTSEIAVDLSQLKHFHLSALLEINVYFVKESHCYVRAVDSHANLEGVQQVFVDQLILIVFDEDAFFDTELSQFVAAGAQVVPLVAAKHLLSQSELPVRHLPLE